MWLLVFLTRWPKHELFEAWLRQRTGFDWFLVLGGIFGVFIWTYCPSEIIELCCGSNRTWFLFWSNRTWFRSKLYLHRQHLHSLPCKFLLTDFALHNRFELSLGKYIFLLIGKRSRRDSGGCGFPNGFENSGISRKGWDLGCQEDCTVL